jgi:hypothetical protein
MAELSGMRPSGVARRFVMFVAVLAFALQSYIAQTHIHDAWQAAGGIVRLAVPQSAQPGGAPLDHGRADCPFCQAVTHLGAALASPALPLILPFAWIETTAIVFTARSDSLSAAHHWKSRAPPRR